MRMHQRDAAVVKSSFNELAEARLLALLKRQKAAEGRVEARDDIDDRDADAQRLAACLAVDRHDTAERLDCGVIARAAAVWTILAEAGDAHMHEAREALAQFFAANAPLFERAGLEILDEDVGAFKQLQKESAPRFLAEIERDAFLVAVQANEIA